MRPVCAEFYLLLSLGVCLAVGRSVKDRHMDVVAVSGEDAVLLCTAERKAGVQYRAVSWYKVQDPSSGARLSGLLMKDLPNGTTKWYTGVERTVEFVNESHSILLPNVTCAETGVYECRLAAPVGEQNREGQVLLTMADCLDAPTENLMTDAYMVIIATAVLMLALVIFRISYVSLKNTLKDRSVTTKKETLLDAPLKPLDKKDLKLIYTLGPKGSKSATMKHICV